MAQAICEAKIGWITDVCTKYLFSVDRSDFCASIGYNVLKNFDAVLMFTLYVSLSVFC